MCGYVMLIDLRPSELSLHTGPGVGFFGTFVRAGDGMGSCFLRDWHFSGRLLFLAALLAIC